jgi:hypothetical protein
MVPACACARFLGLTFLLPGAQVNPKGKGVATPLWIAASKGHHSIVYLLSQHKAKAKVKFNGRSAYDEAVKNGHEKVAELLKKL